MHTHTANYTHPTVIKLKPIEVPKFSGENTEYFQWKQRFMRLVKQDSSPDLVKLTRLREALEGGTAHQIASGIMDGPGAYQAIFSLAELDLWYGGEHRFLEQQERESLVRTAGAKVENVYGLERARAGVTTPPGRRYVKHTGRKERKTEKNTERKRKEKQECLLARICC